MGFFQNINTIHEYDIHRELPEPEIDTIFKLYDNKHYIGTFNCIKNPNSEESCLGCFFLKDNLGKDSRCGIAYDIICTTARKDGIPVIFKKI